MLFWLWLPEDAILSGYSSVSQASSFHWLGPGGPLVIQGSVLQSIHVISSYLFQDAFNVELQEEKNNLSTLNKLDLFVTLACTPGF